MKAPVVALLAALLLTQVVRAGSPRPDDDLSLTDTPQVEAESLQMLLTSTAWPKRGLAALRLERYRDAESAALLDHLRQDPAWQVRCFALRSLARRGTRLPASAFEGETNPRVLRAALRHRHTVQPERVARGVRYLTRRGDPDQMLLGAELGAASGQAELDEPTREAVKRVILRMTRAQAGGLSPRLARLTGAGDLRRHHRWQRWVMETGRGLTVEPVYEIPDIAGPLPPTGLADLEPETFARMVDYLRDLDQQKVDLAICLDTTASMADELAQAQGGLHDLMQFAGEVLKELRIGLVAYRDRRNAYETKWWPLTNDRDAAMAALWSLDADEGGDSPESVYAALKTALERLGWVESHRKVLILVGDAPPHVGQGLLCVEVIELAHARSALTTHVVQASKRPVDHFDAIAESGHGRLVPLDENASLVAELMGLALGDQFEAEIREMFRVYLELCR